jgi:hypothetical protein
MTERQNEYLSIVDDVFCQDCFFCRPIGKVGDKELFQCTNDASDHNEHILLVSLTSSWRNQITINKIREYGGVS